MLTRSYCAFCQGQINDKEEIVEHCVTRLLAHKRCVTAYHETKGTEARFAQQSLPPLGSAPQNGTPSGTCAHPEQSSGDAD